MASISTFLQKIKEAIYGEEVRSSIHDALAAMNEESSNAMQYASTAKESAQASADSAREHAASALQRAEEAASAADTALSAKADAVDAKQNAEDAAAAAKAAAKVAAESKQYSTKPPKPLNGTWWIWDADEQKYLDSGIGCELAGTGIDGIQLTSGNHAPGTYDVYTISLSDGTHQNISVYNGRNGTGTGDVLGSSFDLVIPAAGWRDRKNTIADSRFLALAHYKYFVSADTSSYAEYLECNVRAKDITATGFITFETDINPTEDLTVNVIRFELSANGTT